MDPSTALMAEGKCFSKSQGGAPDLRSWSAYHLENKVFAETLEEVAVHRGVIIREGDVAEATRSDDGISDLVLETGERVSADLFVDCSGFRSELLGKALDEPYQSYDDSLFCNRAVVGGWDRGADEPVLPYTTAETYTSGWAWQIDHDHRINRGYVFSSQFLSDEEAEAEFRKKNPKVGETRFVAFPSGRYRNSWVGNVVALGNSAGFVEPLEATALFTICNCSRVLVGVLKDNQLEPTPSNRKLYNSLSAMIWDEIRDFLAIHYKYNTRIDSPFWEHCRNDTALHGAEPIVEYYRENGPTSAFEIMLLPRDTSVFRLDGFYTILMGQKVPYQKKIEREAGEVRVWNEFKKNCRKIAKSGMSVEEGTKIIRSPQWQWTQGFYRT
jgi:tryptophan halogenase